MAEEAGAPEHARGRLHGVQREPHATAFGGAGGRDFAGELLLPMAGRSGQQSMRR